MDLLSNKQRNLEQSIGEGQSSHAPAARSLSNILDDLDDLLEDHPAS